MRTGIILLLLLLIFISGCSMLPVKIPLSRQRTCCPRHHRSGSQMCGKLYYICLNRHAGTCFPCASIYRGKQVLPTAIKYCTEGSLLPEAATDLLPCAGGNFRVGAFAAGGCSPC